MKNLSKTIYLSGLTLAMASSVLLRTNIIGYKSFVTPAYAVNDNVWICHKNNGNGWSRIPVDPSSINGTGIGDHNDSGHQNGQDIIPAGYWDQNGRNWDATGQAIWNNNCDVPSPTPTPTQVVTPTPTPTSGVTPTPTPTAGVTPTVTPEVTPTVTPEVTPTPTQGETRCNEGSTLVDGVCTHPQPQNGTGGVQSATNSAPSAQGQVLAASTMAKTGVASDIIFNLVGIAGAALTGLSFKKRK